MKPIHVLAAAIAAAALGTVAWSWADTGDFSWPALIVMSAGVPFAALLYASGRLDRPVPGGALFGGATIGVAVALVSHGLVYAFATTFFLGFAGEATELLDRLRVDPEWSAAIGSPWTLLLLIELAVVAPLTEEVGKGLGARLAPLQDRSSAFLAGVAAGTGFAIVENVLYGLSSGFFGGPWEPIVVGRMLGAAVHPLASGLVMLGWWEWKQQRDGRRLAARFFAGVGVHAVWNGSLVVIGVTATVYEGGDTFATLTQVSLAYAAALGILFAGLLWRTTVNVARGGRRPAVDARDGKALTAWVVLASSFVIPMAVLLLAFPGFGP